MSSILPKTVIHVVTFNSARWITPCLYSLFNQDEFSVGENLFVCVTDNASNDGTAEVVEQAFGGVVELFKSPLNTGFTGGHNRGLELLEKFQAQYLFIVNPDIRLEPNALRILVSTLERDPRAGTATPKLMRADDMLQPVEPPKLDAAGMYITPALRHFDRGSEEYDRGQYDRDEYVFGGTGAALLLRRAFIEDTALADRNFPGEKRLFDDAFFAYREDAELAWRGQRLGWKCRYVAGAVGYHRRVVLPERRKDLPPHLNCFSVRNRFLLQADNFSFSANWHCLLPTLWRNILVIGGACTIERSSARALLQAACGLPRALMRNGEVAKRRRARSADLSSWFRFRPYTEPALSSVRSRKPIESLHLIVVNYNSETRLARCLRSISQALAVIRGAPKISVAVVDNASSDGSATRIEPLFAKFPEFSFDFSEKNLGFAGAINRSAARNAADCYMVLNPDVEISAAAILELVRALNEHVELGAVAPVFKHGELVQGGFCAKELPSFGSLLAELFFLHRLWKNNPWTARLHRDGDPFVAQYLARGAAGNAVPHEAPETPLVVAQPAAACLAIRREAFQAVGGFDTGFYPAWFEDVDFCKRLFEAGYLCAVAGTAAVEHEGGYSKAFLGNSKFAEIWYPNLQRYWSKHGNVFHRTVLALVLPIALVLRGIVSVLLAGPGSNRWQQGSSFFRLAWGLTGPGPEPMPASKKAGI